MSSWMEENFPLSGVDSEPDEEPQEPANEPAAEPGEIPEHLNKLLNSFIAVEMLGSMSSIFAMPKPAKQYRLTLTLLDLSDGAELVNMSVIGTGEVVRGAGSAALDPYDT